MKTVKIAPSLLAANFARLEEEVRRVSAADLLHVDVMDGRFVPNITVGPLVVKALRSVTAHFLDVHLMVEEPERHIPAFIEAGSDLITIHAEATPHLHRALSMIRQAGVKAGLAFNPATPLEPLRYLWPLVDLVLVMTVNPGFGGQSFLKELLPKVAAARALIDGAGSTALLEVDGGINGENAAELARAGVDVLVAGSAIFQSPDPAVTLAELRARANAVAC
ncbi:MAG: ribulose-phosphate 3-epimerase [Bacillota bacterium]|nr:ribulose-phosphate 3-epimerase [Bacillota bacterium]